MFFYGFQILSWTPNQLPTAKVNRTMAAAGFKSPKGERMICTTSFSVRLQRSITGHCGGSHRLKMAIPLVRQKVPKSHRRILFEGLYRQQTSVTKLESPTMRTHFSEKSHWTSKFLGNTTLMAIAPYPENAAGCRPETSIARSFGTLRAICTLQHFLSVLRCRDLEGGICRLESKEWPFCRSGTAVLASHPAC